MVYKKQNSLPNRSNFMAMNLLYQVAIQLVIETQGFSETGREIRKNIQ